MLHGEMERSVVECCVVHSESEGKYIQNSAIPELVIVQTLATTKSQEGDKDKKKN